MDNLAFFGDWVFLKFWWFWGFFHLFGVFLFLFLVFLCGAILMFCNFNSGILWSWWRSMLSALKTNIMWPLVINPFSVKVPSFCSNLVCQNCCKWLVCELCRWSYLCSLVFDFSLVCTVIKSLLYYRAVQIF